MSTETLLQMDENILDLAEGCAGAGEVLRCVQFSAADARHFTSPPWVVFVSETNRDRRYLVRIEFSSALPSGEFEFSTDCG